MNTKTGARDTFFGIVCTGSALLRLRLIQFCSEVNGHCIPTPEGEIGQIRPSAYGVLKTGDVIMYIPRAAVIVYSLMLQHAVSTTCALGEYAFRILFPV